MLKSKTVDNIMKYLMIKVGHMEINYGDQHFRRSDNGRANYNPFVGNYIMDAFNTEIGGEVYFRTNGFLAMVGLTNGEIKGNLSDNEDRGFATYSKAGWDGQLGDNIRARLTGSMYMTESSRNLLYSADRTGSRYYYVMVEDGEADNFRAGHFDPGFSKSVTAISINPFVKAGGLEFFGTYEMVTGANSTADGTEDGSYSQLAAEVLYRFLNNESMYIGDRYNMVSGYGTNQTSDNEVSIDRIQVAWGWYLNKYILLKAEYMMQNYNYFPEASVFNEGSFSGGMLEAVVAF